MPLVVAIAVGTGGAAALGAGAAALVGLGTVSTLTATAIGAGLISGGVTALQGGDAGDILKSAALGGVTTYVGGFVGAKVANSVSSATASKFPELSKTFGNIAGATAAGGTSSALMAAAYGGDPVEALIKGGLTAGLSATALSGIQAVTKQSQTFNALPDPAQRAINSALAAKTLGQNPTEAAVAELAESAGNYLKTNLKDYSKELRDSYKKTNTAATNLEDNIKLQQTLADNYNSAIDQYNQDVAGLDPKIDKYEAAKKKYDAAVDAYNKNGPNKYATYYKAKVDETIPALNAAVKDANDYVAFLNGQRDNIASTQANFNKAVADYDTYYNDYVASQKSLTDATDLFTKQEAENVDVVAKAYRDLNNTKSRFETELGRQATTKELASLFNTGDIENSAGDYVAQKKYESMSPEEQLQAKIDFLYSSTADASGTILPASFSRVPRDVMNMPELAPRQGELAGDIIPELQEDGSYTYKRRFTATAPDGTRYEYTGTYDPLDAQRPVTYETVGGLSQDLPSGPGGTLAPVTVSASTTRPVFDTTETPDLSKYNRFPGATNKFIDQGEVIYSKGSGAPNDPVEILGSEPYMAPTATPGSPFTSQDFYKQAVNSAVQARLMSGQAKINLTNAQNELNAATASGDAKAIADAKTKLTNAAAVATEAEAAEKEKVGRLQEVTVEGREEADLRLQRARELMGEGSTQRRGGPPPNIVSNIGLDIERPEIGPFGLIIEEPQAIPDWKSPSLKENFLKASLLKRPGYQSVFDPIEETSEIFEDMPVEGQQPEAPREEPDMYLPFSDFEPSAPVSSTDPNAYTMQNVSQATMTPEPFLSQQKPAAPSFYNYGSPNALLSMTQSPFYTTPTAPTVTLARGGLASFARGGLNTPFAALFAAKGGLGKVPHKGSHYVQGAGGGQDDLIDARLADGEYVFDADIVAALGDGSNKEGAKRLDKMRELIRSHKRGAPNDKIPPKAKSPLAYFKEAK
jgi:hypothetical protein